MSNELKEFIGWKTVVAFTQEKGQLVIEISNNKISKFIIFNSDGKKDSVFISDRFNRAKKNSMEPMHDLTDEVIQNVSIVGKNRIVKIDFTNLCAYFQLFGGDNSNIYLTNFDRKIFDAFKQSEEYFGKQYNISNEEPPEFWELAPSTKICTALATSSYMFGKLYSGLLCNKIELNPETLVGDLTDDQIKLLTEECDSLKSKLLNTNQFYVYDLPETAYTFSLININERKECFVTSKVSEAIRHTLIKEIQSSNFEVNYKKITTKLESMLLKYEKRIAQFKDFDSIDERTKLYRKYGEVLMAQPDLKLKSGNKIKIANWNNEVIDINLDSKLNILDNANKYFDKAKHSEAELQVRKKRIPAEEDKIAKLKELKSRLADIDNNKELEKFVEENRRILELSNVQNANEPSTKFREFELGDNYKLYVGKSAANNDELTMRFAKPNDLWMHARGTSGSHAIVKLDKEIKLPKHILTRAAEITAYYSGSRNAKYVPVVYTFKKYVRKPKGANIGAVVISKEEVIMVEPKLPENSNQPN